MCVLFALNCGIIDLAGEKNIWQIFFYFDGLPCCGADFNSRGITGAVRDV